MITRINGFLKEVKDEIERRRVEKVIQKGKSLRVAEMHEKLVQLNINQLADDILVKVGDLVSRLEQVDRGEEPSCWGSCVNGWESIHVLWREVRWGQGSPWGGAPDPP